MLQDLLILCGPLYDYFTRGKVHAAYKWGIALIVLSQVLFLAISGTKRWVPFADWVLR